MALIKIIVSKIYDLDMLGAESCPARRPKRHLQLKVSIITAVYNGESDIVQTLDSVAAQDHPDIEHIVIDGGSRDGTLALVRQRGLSVSKCISERDRGVYDAFNKGLRLATGEAIAFLNAGDIYLSSGIVSRMSAILASAALEAAFADALIVDRHNPHKVRRRYTSRHFAPGRMRCGIMPAHPSLFMRRTLYDRVGEYNPTFRIAGDYELCLRAFVTQAARYRYLAEPVVRMPDGGISNRGWRSKLLITQEMRRACTMNAIPTNYLLLSSRFALKILELR